MSVTYIQFITHFHKKAKPAHAATELANTQGGSELFWKMHDMIIAEPKKLEISDFRQYAQTLNMDLVQFDNTLNDETKINVLLKADITEAKKCKVTGTPTIFINGLKLVDRSIAGYKSRIDEITKSPER
jgi:protein-disulfide isomerase